MAQVDPHKAQQQAELQEIQRCAADFNYFLVRYLKIVTKDALVIPLRPKPAQLVALADFKHNKRIFTLKGRQIGYSTIVAAWFLWNAMFKENMKVGVLAHTIESCYEIYSIYQNYYKYLPDWMKLAIPTVAANTNELAFAHGSKVKVMSHSTMGGTYQFLHASEFAHYRDITDSMAQVFQMVGAKGQLILETTSNGQNEAYDLWCGSKTYGGKGVWFKRFIWWGMEPEYSNKPLKPSELRPEEIEYAKLIKKELGVTLTLGQMAWVRGKVDEFGGSWNVFHRVYPATPELAFIMTGKKFFSVHYPNVAVLDDGTDYMEFEKADPYAKYVMGVDTASGDSDDNADYSAFTIYRLLPDKKERRLTQSAGFKGRLPVPEYCEKVYAAANNFGAFVVIEANSYGLALLDFFIGKGYEWLFRRIQYDKGVGRVTQQYGFWTGSANRMVALNAFQGMQYNNRIEIKDPRLMKEMNEFEYKTILRAEAGKGSKDDMVMSTAFAIQGLDQLGEYEKSRNRTVRPKNVREILEWEMKTGEIYNDSMYFRDDNGISHEEPDLFISPGDYAEYMKMSLAKS